MLFTQTPLAPGPEPKLPHIVKLSYPLRQSRGVTQEQFGE